MPKVSDCKTGKRKHDEVSVQVSADHYKREFNAHLSPYVCPFCGYWHLKPLLGKVSNA